MIESGKANPSFVFDGEYKIEDAAKAFKDFSEHKIIKAVFKFDKAAENGRRKGDNAETSARKRRR